MERNVNMVLLLILRNEQNQKIILTKNKLTYLKDYITYQAVLRLTLFRLLRTRMINGRLKWRKKILKQKWNTLATVVKHGKIKIYIVI